MNSKVSTIVAAVTLSLGLAASGPALSAPKPQSPDAILNTVKQSPYASIGPLLGNLYEEYLIAARGTNSKTFKSRNPLVKLVNGQVAVDMVARNPSALAESLRAAGATQIKARGPLVSARVPVNALGRLAALDSLNYARPALARTNGLSRPVISQGVASMKAGNLGYTGTGVTVGVLSDSFACDPPAFVPGAPTSTADEDASNGELPAGVNILQDACPGGSDEGRAMAQIVHDVAPGAEIAFHTAFESEFEFAEGIIELQKAGADVTVDDVIYFAEPMFSDGPVAQAVDIVAAKGVPHFSSAGNNGRASYEARYAPAAIAVNAGGNLNGAFGRGPLTRTFHDFSASQPGVQPVQPVLVQSDGVAGIHVLSFQWDQPHLRATEYAQWKAGGDPNTAVGAESDLDLVFFTDKGTVVPLCPPGVATGITCQITGDRNIGGDAVDLAVIVYSGPKPAEVFYVGIVKSGGPDPGHVKYVPFDIQGSFIPLDYDTKSGTSYGHANAAGALSIGAASWYATLPYSNTMKFPPRNPQDFGIDLTSCDPACLNDFSSAGGVPIYLDKFGTALTEAELRKNPSVTGPDGGNSTFFLSDSSYDDDDGDDLNSPFSPFISCCDSPGDEWPNFFGTSASAPHVAGVAALMLQAKPDLEPSDIRSSLEKTARPIAKRFTSNRPVIFTDITKTGPGGYDYDSGHGLVDASEALEDVLSD
jgi:subtilisin family serine protease